MTGYKADYQISGRITGYCGRKKCLKFLIIIQLSYVRMSESPSKRPYYVCPSTCNIHELIAIVPRI